MFDISFVHPYWLFLLEIVPLMILFYFRNYRKQRSVIQLSSLNHVDISRQTLRKRLVHLPFILRIISVGFILIALAEPVKDSVLTSQDKIKSGIIYIIDISRSMLDHDFKPNRLEAVKSSLVQFIEQKDILSGIILMDSLGRVMVPITDDLSALHLAIENIQVNDQVTRPSLFEALPVSFQLLDSLTAHHKYVMCISSGEGNNNTDLAALSSHVNAQGITVSAITVAGEGSISSIQNRKGRLVYRESVSEIDESGLLALCKSSGGSYTRATNSNELDRALLRFSKEPSRNRTSLSKSQSGIFPFTWIAGILLILEIGLRYSVFKSLP